MTGIYKITNPEGAVYIGKSRDIERRFRDHRNGNEKQIRLLNESVKKFGWAAHTTEVLHEFKSGVAKEIMAAYEVYFTEEHIFAGYKMLNLHTGYKLCQETKKKISIANMGRPSPNIGKKLSDATKKKISIANTGNKHTDEEKKKMSIRRTGFKHSEETKKKMSAATMGQNLGKKLSEEQKKKMSEARKGKPWTEARRAHGNSALVGRKLSQETKNKISQTKKTKH